MFAKKKLNRKQYLLESKINTKESLLNASLNSEKDTLLSRISNSRNDLDQLIQISANGDAIRSRVRCVELGEKKSKYFLGLEKRHCDKKFVKSLRNANGVVIFDQHLILSELVNF